MPKFRPGLLFGVLVALTVLIVLMILPKLFPKKLGLESFEVGSNTQTPVGGESNLLILSQERVENLVKAEVPVYLTAFDRDSMKTFTETGPPFVWPNLGYKRDLRFYTSNMSFQPLEGIKVLREITGPDSDKLVASNMDRKLSTCTLAWVLKTNLTLDDPLTQTSPSRVILFECGANVTGNVGVRVSFVSDDSDDTILLEVQWSGAVCRYRLPSLPLKFGDNLLAVVNDNSRINVYLYSLPLKQFMTVEVLQRPTTAGIVLPLSNTPCILFKGTKGVGDHRLRMFMVSYAVSSPQEIELLAGRYVDGVNETLIRNRIRYESITKTLETEKAALAAQLATEEQKMRNLMNYSSELPGNFNASRYTISSVRSPGGSNAATRGSNAAVAGGSNMGALGGSNAAVTGGSNVAVVGGSNAAVTA